MSFECCRVCRSRTPECHADCVKYKVAKDAFNTRQQKIRESKWADREPRLVRNDGIRRMMRKE